MLANFFPKRWFFSCKSNFDNICCQKVSLHRFYFLWAKILAIVLSHVGRNGRLPQWKFQRKCATRTLYSTNNCLRWTPTLKKHNNSNKMLLATTFSWCRTNDLIFWFNFLVRKTSYCISVRGVCYLTPFLYSVNRNSIEPVRR
jgi:hypothetical protein